MRLWGTEDLLYAETKAFGHSHVKIGADACDSWSLPGYLNAAIAHHHGDLKELPTRDIESRKFVEVVQFADELSMHALRKRDRSAEGLKDLIQRFISERSVFLKTQKPKSGLLSELFEEAIGQSGQQFLELNVGPASENGESQYTG